MSPHDRPTWIEVVPAGVAVVALSIGMSSAVPELDGRFVLLVIAGIAAVAAARVLMPAIAVDELEATEFPSPAALPIGGQAQRRTLAPVADASFDVLTLPKIGAGDDENEDSVAIDAARAMVVMSDGASSSFASRLWSRALVDVGVTLRVAADQRTVQAVVDRAASKWHEHHVAEPVPWWAEEGMRRGAFATFLLVQLGVVDGQHCWDAVAVGDSCVLVLRPSAVGWSRVESFPVKSAAAFGSNPPLVGSVQTTVAGLEHGRGQLQPGDVLLVATDAVSEWAMSHDEAPALLAELDVNALGEVLRGEREENRMVNDDVTVARLRVGHSAEAVQEGRGHD